jgi:hypothetical protein
VLKMSEASATLAAVVDAESGLRLHLASRPTPDNLEESGNSSPIWQAASTSRTPTSYG